MYIFHTDTNYYIFFIFVVDDCRRVVFFFFQAEDGIRDLTVTGVQTCALPISEGGVFLNTSPSAMNNPTPDAPSLAPANGWVLLPKFGSSSAVGRVSQCVRYSKIGRASCRERV